MDTHIRCPEGHFVCDDCHRQDSLKAIESICLQSDSRDPVALALEIMRLPFVPMHGPEHHALVPTVLVAAYRNVTRGVGGVSDVSAAAKVGAAGSERDVSASANVGAAGKADTASNIGTAGDVGTAENVGAPRSIGERAIREALRRGSETPGGACGRLGACGGAVGAGVAWSIISRATPLSVRERGQALALTARVLETVSKHGGPRCCKRDSLTAIQVAMNSIEELTGIKFERAVNPAGACEYHVRNRQCIRLRCPYFPESIKGSPSEPVGAGQGTDCGCEDGGDDRCQC
jgi:hypothetical protein